MPTPKELRELALASAASEYKRVIDALEEVAKQAKFSAEFSNISDGTRQLLMSAGYKVENVYYNPVSKVTTYRVSF